MREMLRDFLSFLGWLLVIALVFGGPLVACGMLGDHAACGRICEANGAENGWDWWAGCYCKDERGLYNPKDSRETR